MVNDCYIEITDGIPFSLKCGLFTEDLSMEFMKGK